MKIIVFLILSIIIAFLPLNVLRTAISDPNFGSFGGKAVYFRLLFILLIAALLIYGLFNLMF